MAHMTLLVVHFFYYLNNTTTTYGSVLLQCLTAQYPSYIQFICSIDYNQYEEIKSCNKITNNILHQEDKDFFWKLKRITTNEEPLIPSKPR